MLMASNGLAGPVLTVIQGSHSMSNVLASNLIMYGVEAVLYDTNSIQLLYIKEPYRLWLSILHTPSQWSLLVHSIDLVSEDILMPH